MANPASQYLLPKEWSLEQGIRVLGEAFMLDSDPDKALTRIYYDTFNWRLYQGGELLKLERVGREQQLVWSGLDDHRAKQILRNPEQIPRFAQHLPRGAMRDRLAPLMSMRALLPVVEVKTRVVTLRVLDDEEKTVLRIALEEGQSRAPKTAALRALPVRVRLLPVRGYGEELKKVRQFLEGELALKADKRGVLHRALKAIGRRPGDYSSRLNFKLDPQARADQVARQIHLHLLDTLERNIAGTKADLDTEFLHDLRVAVRRTRSALTQIKGVFTEEEVERFKSRFSWIGQITGPTRDLDVYLLDYGRYRDSLPKSFRKDLEPLHAFLIDHRQREHKALVRRLNSPHFRVLVKEWREFLETETPETALAPNAGKKIKKLADKRIYKTYERVLMDGLMILPNSPAEMLHELRKECKKLRYLLEFFQSLYPRKKVRILIKALKVLLDNLGDFQDLEVQAHKLRELAHQMQAEGNVPADTLLAMGMLVNSLLHRQQQAREEFADCFSVFSGREVSDIFEALFPRKEKRDLWGEA